MTALSTTTTGHATLQDTLLLGAHVRACERARERSFGLKCAAERVHGVLGPRLITLVLAVTGLLALLAGSA